MFAVYRVLISCIAISLLTTFSATASAKTSHSAGKNLENAHAICNAAGERIWDISEKSREIMLACETPRASMAWNKKREGAFLITCDCECTSHDNTGWIVDLTASDQARKVQQVPLGKEATIEMLGSAPKKINDTYSSHPLCENIDREKLKSSIFVSLLKRPTGNDREPYCFSPGYIIDDSGMLKFKANSSGDNDGDSLCIEDDESISKPEVLKAIEKILKFLHAH